LVAELGDRREIVPADGLADVALRQGCAAHGEREVQLTAAKPLHQVDPIAFNTQPKA
jgi:hypothetical protein